MSLDTPRMRTGHSHYRSVIDGLAAPQHVAGVPEAVAGVGTIRCREG